MRGRVLAVSIALLWIAAACSSFDSTPVPTDLDASAPIDAYVPTEASPEAGPTCIDPKVGVAETRFESKHGSPHALKTDGVYLYVAADMGIERANAAGAVGYTAIRESLHIDDIATTSKAMFYLTGGHARYREHTNFVDGCADDCEIGPFYNALFGDGTSDVAIGGRIYTAGNLTFQEVKLLSHNDPRALTARDGFVLENAATATGIAVVSGKLTGETTSKVFRTDDLDAGPLPIAPVQMVSNGKALYFTEGDGSVNAFDIVTRTKVTIATKQPTPLKNAFLTNTHFWFGTQAGIRRVRLSDNCVQAITSSLTGPFVVVGGSKLVTLDAAKVLMSDVSD